MYDNRDASAIAEFTQPSGKRRGARHVEKTIGAYESRRRFGQLIEEAFYRRDHFIVERAGRPMAVIVSIDDYERWQRLAKARFFSMLDAVWGRTEGVPTDELEKDVDEALASLREELRAQEGPRWSHARRLEPTTLSLPTRGHAPASAGRTPVQRDGR